MTQSWYLSLSPELQPEISKETNLEMAPACANDDAMCNLNSTDYLMSHERTTPFNTVWGAKLGPLP